MKNILEFLKELNLNNNREWFQDNKKWYNECRAEHEAFIQRLINELSETDHRLSGLLAKDTLFRIYRDVRFSKNKEPYKTHFGAYMARGGRKSAEAAYYFHVGHDEILIGSGSYAPPKEELLAIRQEILYQPEEYMKRLKEMKEKGFELMESDKLKIGPKGFPKDSPHLELIKNKHYILIRNYTEEEALHTDFFTMLIKDFKGSFPFVSFLNTALEFKGNE